MDCKETYQEVCEPDWIESDGAESCMVKTEVDCEPFGPHSDLPTTSCRQVRRLQRYPTGLLNLQA